MKAFLFSFPSDGLARQMYLFKASNPHSLDYPMRTIPPKELFCQNKNKTIAFYGALVSGHKHHLLQLAVDCI